ncbi:MAG: stress response protein [Actinobacteria bacterium]|nr:stress response protein [Actinomycetota bacterium]
MPVGGNGFESEWTPARLLSTIGLRGEEERERRATSALLAVMMAVPEFGQAVISELGGPKGRITAFTEVQMKDENGVRHIPDGAIVCRRGKSSWCALVEVKTGSAKVKSEQVTRYLDLARVNKFDAVVTITNEITASRDDAIVHVDKRKLKSVKLLNVSWWRILTMAILHHRYKGVSDPDQAWILGELIAYLDSERSGASGFLGMGDEWVAVRDAVGHGTLRSSDPGAKDVATRWDQFVEYMALSLSQELGREVRPVRARGAEPEARRDKFVQEMVVDGTLSGDLKIPDAVGPVRVVADLRTRKVTTLVSIAAPAEGRPQTRINWILKQLRGAPSDLRIDVRFSSAKESSSLLLVDAIENPQGLLSANDKRREPRSFELALVRKMGLKRGIDAGSFARETRRQMLIFYRDIVQDLTPWRAAAPKLSESATEEVNEVSAVDGAPAVSPESDAMDSEVSREAVMYATEQSELSAREGQLPSH